MLDPDKYPFCSEFYIVEKTVEVVAKVGSKTEQIRIEAIYDPRNGHYKTRSYRLEHVNVQSYYGESRSIDTDLWLEYNLPWTNRDSADGAIAQALHFLSERVSSS